VRIRPFVAPALAVAVALVAVMAVGFLVRPRLSRAQATGAVANCDTQGQPYGVVQIDTYPRVNLELARTAPDQELGLGYRQELPLDNGMLFVYTSQSTDPYWMIHTLIPLSIAYIAGDGTIEDIQDMAVLNNPHDVQEASRHIYPPAAPYWYALEVNQGWFVEHGVGVGQQFMFCLGA